MGAMFTSKRNVQHPYAVGLRTTSGITQNINQYFSASGSPSSTGFIADAVTSYRSGGVASGALSDSQILQDAEFEARQTLMPYDNGHPFSSESWKVSVNPRHFDILGTHAGYRWQGNFVLYLGGNTPFANWKNGFTPSNLNVLGAQAINQTVPTKPSVSVAEILAQLKQGQELPELRSTINLIPELFSANNLKEIANRFLLKGSSQYLNLEFGWKPFISDLKGIASAVLKSQKTISQLLRDDGRPVRRRFYFPIQQVNSTFLGPRSAEAVQSDGSLGSLVGFLPGVGSYGASFGLFAGDVTATRSTRTVQWFSGEYMYHLPKRDSLAGKFAYYAEEAQKLLGLELTPVALWDLTPWTWLGDWLADFSTVISNGTLFSDPNTNLVLRYGYMMETVVDIYNIVWTGAQIGNYHAGNLSTTYTHTLKRRAQATPFGFGLSVTGFTPEQWAILGSLGLLRGNSIYHKP